MFDVHSYRSGRDFGLQSTPDVILLDKPGTTKSGAASLSESLNAAGISSKVMQGSIKNDIQHEAQQMGGNAYLMELRQDLPAEKVAQIARVVGEN